jgi:hypothetical protein
MVVDKDDNLILADGSFLRMYSKDGKSVKECKLGGKTWIFLTTKVLYYSMIISGHFYV